jgi:adenine-specific DNA-methyltransferase
MSTKQPKGEPISKTAPNLFAERIEEFKQLFPEVVTEGKIDFDKMRMALGEEVDGKPERYTFTWAGKKDAIRLLQVPSRATLVPDKDESINFDTTQNIFIEGDNLEVLKLLWKPYFSKVKMIYIDPPYNTGEDLIYHDDYADPLSTYLTLSGQKDLEGNLLTSNPETSGRFHSTWLSMIYPRLFLARQLLKEDGLIFVSIDDTEFANLRLVMNEIFGEDNFIASIVWKKRYQGAKEKYLVAIHDYIVLYAKDKQILPPIYVPSDKEYIEQYYTNKDEMYEIRGPYRTQPLEAGKSMGDRKNLAYPIPAPDGTEAWPKRQWIWERPRVMKALERKELEFSRGKDGKWTVSIKQYLKNEKGEVRGSKAFTIIDNIYTQHGTAEITEMFGDGQIFPFPKPSGLIKTLLNVGSSAEDEDIILDFFAGSAPSAQAILELNHEDGGNRRFLLVQLPELTPEDSAAKKAGYDTIAEIGKERIRRVIAKLKKEAEGKMELGNRDTPEDLGFKVFKLAESNYRPWVGVEDKDPEAYAKQMELYLDPLVEGWQEENVIYEVALKEGYSLACLIEKADKITENNIWRVTDEDKGQSFYICLDDDIKQDAVKALELTADCLFICLPMNWQLT